MRSSSLVMAGLLATGLLSTSAWARSTGFTGRSGKPAADGSATQICTSCHAPGAVVPTVEIAGPRSVTPGSTNAYSFIIRGGPAVVGGMNLSVNKTDVALATVDSSLKLLNSELTHTAAKAFASGEVRFDFSLTAPASAGTFTLYAAGNSANGADGNRNDGVERTLLEVQVEAASIPDAGPPPEGPDAGPPPGGPDGGPPPGGPDGGPPPEGPDAGPPPGGPDAGTPPGPDADGGAGTGTPETDGGTGTGHDHGGGKGEDTGGGCSSTGGAPLMVLVLSAVGLTLMRRRRA